MASIKRAQGDPWREDEFYRFNRSLQELFNLVAHVPAD